MAKKRFARFDCTPLERSNDVARLVSLNIERSKHLDRFIPFLREHKPDVVCLQELVQADIRGIQNSTGLMHRHYVPMAIHPGDGLSFGLGILARLPFIETDSVVYGGTGQGGMVLDRTTPESRLSTCRYAAAVVRLNVNGQELRIATTHFPWTPDGRPRTFQVDAARRLIEGLGPKPVIVTGDFNAPRGGPIFAELARAWPDCIPADVTTSLDPLLHRAGPLELMVDGLFASPAYHVDDVRLHQGVSDHQAVSARLSRSP